MQCFTGSTSLRTVYFLDVPVKLQHGSNLAVNHAYLCTPVKTLPASGQDIIIANGLHCWLQAFDIYTAYLMLEHAACPCQDKPPRRVLVLTDHHPPHAHHLRWEGLALMRRVRQKLHTRVCSCQSSGLGSLAFDPKVCQTSVFQTRRAASSALLVGSTGSHQKQCHPSETKQSTLVHLTLARSVLHKGIDNGKLLKRIALSSPNEVQYSLVPSLEQGQKPYMLVKAPRHERLLLELMSTMRPIHDILVQAGHAGDQPQQLS